LPEVHILNATQKSWNSDDYLEGYCKLGYPDYIKYNFFKNKYGFQHNICMAMLSDSTSMPGSSVQHFHNGQFKIKNWKNAVDMADKIMLIEPFYEGFQRRSFVYALISLFKKPQFEFTEFIQKLRLQPTALMNCNDAEQYITLIEHIYNYRRSSKINLRY
jgi:hypothetical protein